ncbi:MAG: hypothetical protein ACF8XB_15225 [Planctomycetota bacterium JB042]
MAGKSETPFAKDFGYLRPFLGKVRAHADALEGARGERLRSLLAEEQQRWDEIAALLGGASPPSPPPPAEPAGGPSDSASEAPSEGPVPSADEAAPVPREEMARGDRSGLTVGSLRGDRRRGR